jgi:hypothetical protein
MSSLTDPSINPETDPNNPKGSVKAFFDKYFVKKISMSANEVDSVVGFFEKRGFDKQSAIATSSVLLQQAKIDNVKVFSLLDTLRGLNEVQISQLVAAILNSNRSAVSGLGYRINSDFITKEQRNIKL